MMEIRNIKRLLAVVAVMLTFNFANAADWSKYSIGIDPGHGGSDRGIQKNEVNEADLALRCALTLRDRIKGYGAAVGMTRETNTDVSLTSRKNWSVSYDPWIFLSIHLDSYSGTSNGSRTYYYWTTGNSSFLAARMQAAVAYQLSSVSTLEQNNQGIAQSSAEQLTGSSNVPACMTYAMYLGSDNTYQNIRKQYYAGFDQWVFGHIVGCWDHFTQKFGVTITNPRQEYGNSPLLYTSEQKANLEITQPEGNKYVDINFAASNLPSDVQVRCDCDNANIEKLNWTRSSGTLRISIQDINRIGDWSGDIVLYTTDGREYVGIATRVKVNPKPVLKGDSNDDDQVTEADVQTTINHILGKPTEKFNSNAADVNSDSKINIIDVAGTVKIVNQK